MRSALAATLGVEMLKLRRTLALGLTVAAPLLVVLLQTILFTSAPLGPIMLYSLLGACLVAALGCRNVTGRDVA